MNDDKFSSFSPEDQAILSESAHEAAQYYKELVLEQDADLEKSLAEDGVTITRLTEEQLAPFREKANKIYDNYRDVIGADVVDKFMEYAGKK